MIPIERSRNGFVISVKNFDMFSSKKMVFIFEVMTSKPKKISPKPAMRFPPSASFGNFFFVNIESITPINEKEIITCVKGIEEDDKPPKATS